ncbi:MAG: mechanosensitive ion channel domain-containing protein [Bacteroidales bacterium]|nr:mechanosensitive ion channel family protein [Bacteroidales bacterium]
MNLTSILKSIGINSEGLLIFLNTTISIFIIGLIGWISYIIARKYLAHIIIKIAGNTSTNWDNLLFDKKFFRRLGYLISAIVIQIGLTSLEWQYMGIIHKFISAWITFSSVLLFSSVLDGVNRIWESYPISKEKPLKIFTQVLMIFVWCVAMIVVVSIFTGKSLLILLGGLTAFAAVLILVFQDSILGFVAGIQLSANNMVKIGDWIVMANRGVDGDVLEINLTTVKVQNWDKTITTIPTHKLVSESFTNWRGMQESKGRRIMRSINIDINTIHHLSDAEIEQLKSSELLKDYLEQKLNMLESYNTTTNTPLDRHKLTNIGTFREYLGTWLSHNPDINLEMTHMVRQLQSGPTGVPIEIYCFSAKQSWIDYERVQSDIFDHVFAVMELFNLKPFQYSAGTVATLNNK